jgi:uncharacterized protein with GYD domain
MPLYATLLKYTSEGFKDISEDRLKQNISMIESKGGKFVAGYGLIGEWDILVITEFPDEQSAMKALLTTCQSGIGTTQTMTALPIEDFVKLAQNP